MSWNVDDDWHRNPDHSIRHHRVRCARHRIVHEEWSMPMVADSRHVGKRDRWDRQVVVVVGECDRWRCYRHLGVTANPIPVPVAHASSGGASTVSVATLCMGLVRTAVDDVWSHLGWRWWHMQDRMWDVDAVDITLQGRGDAVVH